MFRIVVTPKLVRKKTHYTIDVLDLATGKVINGKEAKTPIERSDFTNEFRELYLTDDVKLIRPKVKKHDKKPVAKKVKIVEETPRINYDGSELGLQRYIEANPGIMYDRIVLTVTQALETNKKVIRLFELNDTGVYLTAAKKGWKPGLVEALGWYEKDSNYEKCGLVRDLIKKLGK